MKKMRNTVKPRGQTVQKSQINKKQKLTKIRKPNYKKAYNRSL